MSDPGLNHRLRQRSRRAGIMIGVSMALTIAVCVVGFTVIYNALSAYTSDFVTQEEPTMPPTTAPTNPPPQTSSNDGQDAPNPTAEPTQGQAIEQNPNAQPTGTPGAFTPDYQIGSTGSVNLRSGPGTSFDSVIALPYQTPLQYLDETQTTSDPDANTEWMKFRTEDGEEGWVRQIDVENYEP
ncbi:MAG: SH3 domain-containing protein [Thermomicrobiales bacterium]